MVKRGGRRPGNSGTRDAILLSARASFAQVGFAATTMRGVAAEAGVDSALVHHFFGTKDELFAASLELPTGFAAHLPQLLDDDPTTVGEQLARSYLSLWEDEATSPALRALLRSSLTHEGAGSLLREFIGSQLLIGAASRLDGDAPELRVTLATSHLVGVALSRYVVRVAPLAEADLDVLVAAIAPVVQHYLTGDLAAPV